MLKKKTLQNKQFIIKHKNPALRKLGAGFFFSAVNFGQGERKIRYIYDAGGITGFLYNHPGESSESYCSFGKDAEGNVKQLICYAQIVAEYNYDAFGKCTVTKHAFNYPGGYGRTVPYELGDINPIRWKSHYYDTESELYYIDGRYYDADIGRWVSPKSYLETVGGSGPYALNRYNFCDNSHISYPEYAAGVYPGLELQPYVAEPTWWDWNGWWVQLAAGAVVIGVTAGIGAIYGAVAAAGCATAGAAQATMSIAAAGITSALVGALSGAITGAVFGGIAGYISGGADGVIDGMLNGMAQGATAGFMMGAITGSASELAKVIRAPVCFAAGTLVLTEDGNKRIEEVEVGDGVWAYDEETGERALKEVVQVFRNQTFDWCTTYVETEDGSIDEITSTPGHKYYLPFNNENREIGERLEHASYEGLSNKWVSACNLKHGDNVLLSSGKYGIVRRVETKHLDTPETTYNFEVEGFHTYYVGEQSVCVHNANCNIQTGDTKDFSIHDSKRAAYRAAKRDAGVVGMQPDKPVGLAYNRQGHMIPGKTYTFGDKQILWHLAGHPEYGMTRHFNYNGWHYFY